MPPGVKEIGISVFGGCSKLHNVKLSEPLKRTEAKKPEWIAATDEKLSSEIAGSIEKYLSFQLNGKEWAALYLTQTAMDFKALFKTYMADSPNGFLSAMTDILIERAKTDMLTRAARCAAEHNKKIKPELINLLYEFVKSQKTREKQGRS